MEWHRGAVASCQEADEFHKLSLAVLDDFLEAVSENDLLLLSKEKVDFLVSFGLRFIFSYLMTLQ